MRVFAALVRQGMKVMLAYQWENYMGLVGNFAFLLLFSALWSALLRGDPEAQARMLSYVFIGQILQNWTFTPTWELAERFRMGDVALELAKPLSLPVRVLGDFLGRNIVRVLRALPAFAVVGFLMGIRFPDGPQFGLFLVSAGLAWIINGCLYVGITLISLWTTYFDQANQIVEFLEGVFSGYFVPLWYMPPIMAAIARYSPFPGMFFTPAAIFSGGLQGAEALSALALQALWAGASLLILYGIWLGGVRKLTVMGG
ncbi:MAG: ABC-2 family transporter protein [Bacillota bacterium]|nr:MAG: hypothetical protein DIU70_02460 [Bacillota bacterium]